MSIFNLWYPSLSDQDNKSVFVVITRGDSYSINKGTKEFCVSLTSAIGMGSSPEAWSFLSCRTTYFSDYLGEADWRDSWQPAWFAEISFPETLSPGSIWKQPAADLNAMDSSWSLGTAESSLSHPLFAIRFSSAKSATKFKKEIEQKIGSKEISRIESLKSASRETIICMILSKQKNSFFENGSETTAKVESCAAECGGKLHYVDR